MNQQWVQQQVDRLIADPAYRIEVAVHNNPAGAAVAYNHYYQDNRPVSGQQAAAHLQFLYESNPTLALRIADNIPWVPGATREYDQVFGQLSAELIGQPDPLNDADTAKAVDFTGWGSAITALAGAVGMIGSGQRAEDAAEADQARLYLEGQNNAAADAAKSERLKTILKALGIGAAIIGAIVVLVLLFRRSPAVEA